MEKSDSVKIYLSEKYLFFREKVVRWLRIWYILLKGPDKADSQGFWYGYYGYEERIMKNEYRKYILWEKIPNSIRIRKENRLSA